MGIPATLSSVPATTPYIQYVATSGQTVFPYPFVITQDSDLVVVDNGVTYDTDAGYTVSGVGNATGGNVTLTTGATAGDIITLYRDIPIERLTQFAQNGGFSSTAFNAEFNNIYLLLQQLQTSIDQCLQIPNTNNPAPTVSLTPASYANKYLAFDANGNPEPAELTTSGDLTASILGSLLYPTSDAENAAEVIPVDKTFRWGDIRRYGAAVDGVTDDRGAITNAYAQSRQAGGACLILPAGTSYVSQNGSNGYALLCHGDVIFDGRGAFTLKGDGVNDYTLIYATGGTDIDVDIRGITFDCGKTTPSRPSDNNDICVRILSSINTLNIEDCTFQNYDEDGLYINATVTGTGGSVHHNRFNNGARSATYITAGQYISVARNKISGILLSPVVVQPANATTVLRDIDVDDNEILGGGTDTNSTSDRAGIYLGGEQGEASVQSFLRARGNRIRNFGVGYTGGHLVLGIETRQTTDVLVKENEVTGCPGIGLYSYLTTRAVYQGNHSIGNGTGLEMNSCTDYSDIANVCNGNTTKDRNYHGADAASTYLQADGLNAILGRASVTVTGGAITVNSAWNLTATYVSAGTVKFSFVNAPNDANYSVMPVFRSFGSTSGLITSSAHTQTDFKVVTLASGSATDESYDLLVVGPLANTTAPP